MDSCIKVYWITESMFMLQMISGSLYILRLHTPDSEDVASDPTQILKLEKIISEYGMLLI